MLELVYQYVGYQTGMISSKLIVSLVDHNGTFNDTNGNEISARDKFWNDFAVSIMWIGKDCGIPPTFDRMNLFYPLKSLMQR